MSFRSIRLVPLALIALVGLIATACGGDDPTATPVPPEPTATPVPAEPTATPTPLPPGVTPPPAPPTPTPVPPPPPPEPTPTPSFDAVAYFTDQTITMNTGFSPGGGYDTFSRLLARFGPKHMPGNPRFVVRNIPGGGGLRGLQQTNRDAADGYTIGILHPRFVKRELSGEDVEGFDLGAINFIGSASSGIGVNGMYVHRDVATSWEEVLATGRTFINGETSPGSSTGAGAAFIELLGGPIKTVYGYGGSAEVLAAFDRRENDITTNGSPDSVPRLFPEWITGKFLYPVLRAGSDPSVDPEWEPWLRALDAVDPPHVLDVLDLTDDQKAVFRLSESTDDTFSRTFVLHPDTPDHLTNLWVGAFANMVTDPDFEPAVEIAGYELGYTDPATMQAAAQDGLRLLQDQALREIFVTLAGTGQ